MRAPFAFGTAVLAAVIALAFSAPAAPAASTPCWQSLIADWSKDQSIDGRYPASCYRQAMQSAPTDLKIYSTLEDDLQAALRTRSSRRLSGAHVTAASLDAAGRPSSGSFLIALIAGLAGLVLACAAVAAIVRRRRAAR